MFRVFRETLFFHGVNALLAQQLIEAAHGSLWVAGVNLAAQGAVLLTGQQALLVGSFQADNGAHVDLVHAVFASLFSGQKDGPCHESQYHHIAADQEPERLCNGNTKQLCTADCSFSQHDLAAPGSYRGAVVAIVCGRGCVLVSLHGLSTFLIIR
jgi:hypothetical protein